MTIANPKEAEFGESYRLSELQDVPECEQNRTWEHMGRKGPHSLRGLSGGSGRSALDSTVAK